jgi:hypothetical protein
MKPKKKSIDDLYIKVIKKTDRELELENNPGFKSNTKIHKSKKVYDRKRKDNNDFEDF